MARGTVRIRWFVALVVHADACMYEV